MLSKKKKIFILSGMLVLLVVAGYLNVMLNNRVVETSGTITTSTGSFFATYRNDRQSTRDQEFAYYDAIMTSEASGSEAKQIAENKKLEIIELMEAELAIEGLIKAKGFEDVVVTNSTSNINVIVKSAELSSTEVAQIVDIITTQTGRSIDNIKIIPVE